MCAVLNQNCKAKLIYQKAKELEDEEQSNYLKVNLYELGNVKQKSGKTEKVPHNV